MATSFDSTSEPTAISFYIANTAVSSEQKYLKLDTTFIPQMLTGAGHKKSCSATHPTFYSKLSGNRIFVAEKCGMNMVVRHNNLQDFI